MRATVLEPFVLGAQVVSVAHRDRSFVRGGGGAGITPEDTGFTFLIAVHTVYERATEVWMRLPNGIEEFLNLITGVDDFPGWPGRML